MFELCLRICYVYTIVAGLHLGLHVCHLSSSHMALSPSYTLHGIIVNLSRSLISCLDFDPEVTRYHKPVVHCGPVFVRLFQFEVKVSYDLGYQLRHLQI